MNPEDVRRMVRGWEAVERREREERRKAGPDTAAAVQGALALMDLFGEMHGWPPAENEARRRDNELARALGSASAVSNKPMAKRPSQKIRKALADLAKALHRLEAPSMVIGGIAVIAHGVARQTIDIDATVLATQLETSQILAALADYSIRPRIVDALGFAERSQVLLLVHEKTQITLEVSLAFSSFEQEALER